MVTNSFTKQLEGRTCPFKVRAMYPASGYVPGHRMKNGEQGR